MEFVGTITAEAEGGFCSGIETLHIWSQGETREKAAAMAVDALEELAQDYLGRRLGARLVSIDGERCDRFIVRCEDSAAVCSFIVRHLRTESQVSIRELAERVGTRGPNSVRQYETGEHAPTIAKFEEFLHAMGKVLRIEIVDEVRLD